MPSGSISVRQLCGTALTTANSLKRKATVVVAVVVAETEGSVTDDYSTVAGSVVGVVMADASSEGAVKATLRAQPLLAQCRPVAAPISTHDVLIPLPRLHP